MKNLTYLLVSLSLLISCGTENVPVYNLITTALPPEGGTISPPSGPFSQGDVIQVSARPTEGWEFLRWDGDVTGSGNPVVVEITKDTRIVALFQPVEVPVVFNPATGQTWMDRNLGAVRVATSRTDSLAYGDLFQWGREADQHQNRNSGMVMTLSDSDRPRITNFILAPNTPFDWRSPQNAALWQGVDGVNNPCPPGFRIPTQAEWEAERQSWTSNDVEGAFASVLKLPSAGRRNFSAGTLFDVHLFAYYWSSSTEGSFSRGLGIFSEAASIFSYNRAGGNSVRCIKD